jgi:hypothetical protein
LLTVGMSVNGTGIPNNTTIASILSASSITLSQAATSSVSANMISFEIATGQRYNASLNGTLVGSFTGSATYFPGNAAGASTTGGQYQ